MRQLLACAAAIFLIVAVSFHLMGNELAAETAGDLLFFTLFGAVLAPDWRRGAPPKQS
jgi:hypothetical protein